MFVSTAVVELLDSTTICIAINNTLANPRRACAARVTGLCVCLLSHISPVKQDKKICRVFSETASFKSYGAICLPTGILQ